MLVCSVAINPCGSVMNLFCPARWNINNHIFCFPRFLQWAYKKGGPSKRKEIKNFGLGKLKVSGGQEIH